MEQTLYCDLSASKINIFSPMINVTEIVEQLSTKIQYTMEISYSIIFKICMLKCVLD